MGKPDNKINSTKLHKTFFRMFIRDIRLHPRERLLAQLLLGYMEETHPRPLLESLIREMYGTPDKPRIKSDTDLETSIDATAAKSLKEEWRKVVEESKGESKGGEDASRISAGS
jgi:hypothetical protein